LSFDVLLSCVLFTFIPPFVKLFATFVLKSVGGIATPLIVVSQHQLF
jgi:hypothetical protein